MKLIRGLVDEKNDDQKKVMKKSSIKIGKKRLAGSKKNVVSIRMKIILGVITSYSIHYTKLYEATNLL